MLTGLVAIARADHPPAPDPKPLQLLKKADAHSLSFEASSGDGLRSPSEMHMHALTLAWTDGDHIRETWTSFDQGKPKDEKVFDLTRKK